MGAKIVSVIAGDIRFPESDAGEAAHEFLHARGPSTIVNALREWVRRNAGPEPNPEPAPATAAPNVDAAGVQTRRGGVQPSPANNVEQAPAPAAALTELLEADRLRSYNIAQQDVCLAASLFHTSVYSLLVACTKPDNKHTLRLCARAGGNPSEYEGPLRP
eukprot:4091780-Pleurochrysis_carterae.AAC.1